MCANHDKEHTGLLCVVPYLVLAKFGWESLFDLPFVDQRDGIDCLDRGSVPAILRTKRSALGVSSVPLVSNVYTPGSFHDFFVLVGMIRRPVFQNVALQQLYQLRHHKGEPLRDGHRVLPVVFVFAYRYLGLKFVSQEIASLLLPRSL